MSDSRDWRSKFQLKIDQTKLENVSMEGNNLQLREERQYQNNPRIPSSSITQL